MLESTKIKLKLSLWTYQEVVKVLRMKILRSIGQKSQICVKTLDFCPSLSPCCSKSNVAPNGNGKGGKSSLNKSLSAGGSSLEQIEVREWETIGFLERETERNKWDVFKPICPLWVFIHASQSTIFRLTMALCRPKRSIFRWKCRHFWVKVSTPLCQISILSNSSKYRWFWRQKGSIFLSKVSTPL